MSADTASLEKRKWGETSRKDNWRVVPITVFTILTSFIVYATWAAFQGEHYTFGEYLSPFYSPEIFGTSHHAWFPIPDWIPGWIPFTPALLILPFPAGFRMTCYYYRGAYYKAFWQDPPACSVGEPRKGYLGENSFPLIMQNIHRYFLYFALLFLVFLSYDAYRGFWFKDEGAETFSFGIGVGTIVVTMNVILLGGYTLGCHSLRHLVGGYMNNFSKNPIRAKCHACVSMFNIKHMLWAWCSLFWVAFSDIYVRMCSMGIWTDIRIL